MRYMYTVILNDRTEIRTRFNRTKETTALDLVRKILTKVGRQRDKIVTKYELKDQDGNIVEFTAPCEELNADQTYYLNTKPREEQLQDEG